MSEVETKKRDIFKEAFIAAAEGKTVILTETPDLPYVRLFFHPAYFSQRNGIGLQSFSITLDNALSGGIFFGHPKFGGCDIIKAGKAPMISGEENPYFDFYPREKIDFGSAENKTAAEVCGEIIRRKSLMAQLERDGVLEVHTSFGEAISFTPRPIVAIPTPTI